MCRIAGRSAIDEVPTFDQAACGFAEAEKSGEPADVDVFKSAVGIEMKITSAWCGFRLGVDGSAERGELCRECKTAFGEVAQVDGEVFDADIRCEDAARDAGA